MLQRALGLLAIIGAVASLSVALTCRAEPPALRLPDAVEVKATAGNQSGVAEVCFENPCSYPIEVLELIPSCACTKVELTDKIVQPGQTGMMRVDVELAERPASPTLTVVFHGVRSSVVSRQAITLLAPGTDLPALAE